MPRSGANDTVSIHLRTDVLLTRRDGDREVKDRSLVWNLHVDIPIWQTRVLRHPERAVVEEIMQLVKEQFQSNGLIEDIVQRTANLLAQDI